mmetsp:Transcript_72225/g.169259  ORF Transcript_72225/g.169259 Transcript_72225/m.169259 type:complete len:238 (+) Transcript_72225:106-819(+)
MCHLRPARLTLASLLQEGAQVLLAIPLRCVCSRLSFCSRDPLHVIQDLVSFRVRTHAVLQSGVPARKASGDRRHLVSRNEHALEGLERRKPRHLGQLAHYSDGRNLDISTCMQLCHTLSGSRLPYPNTIYIAARCNTTSVARSCTAVHCSSVTNVWTAVLRKVGCGEAAKTTVAGSNKQFGCGRSCAQTMDLGRHTACEQRLASAHIPKADRTVQTPCGNDLARSAATSEKGQRCYR